MTPRRIVAAAIAAAIAIIAVAAARVALRRTRSAGPVDSTPTLLLRITADGDPPGTLSEIRTSSLRDAVR
jgi:hypothetical protein